MSLAPSKPFAVGVLLLLIYACSDAISDAESPGLEPIAQEQCQQKDYCGEQRKCVEIPRSPSHSDFFCAKECDAPKDCPDGETCRSSSPDYFDLLEFCLPPIPTCDVLASEEDCTCFYHPTVATRIRGTGEDCEILEDAAPVCYRPGAGCGDACINHHWRYDLPNGEALWVANTSDSMSEGWVNVNPKESCPLAPRL